MEEQQEHDLSLFQLPSEVTTPSPLAITALIFSARFGCKSSPSPTHNTFFATSHWSVNTFTPFQRMKCCGRSFVLTLGSHNKRDPSTGSKHSRSNVEDINLLMLFGLFWVMLIGLLPPLSKLFLSQSCKVANQLFVGGCCWILVQSQ